MSDIFNGRLREKDQSPLPYMGIEESLKYLVDTVKEMRAELADMKTRIDLKAYSIKEIAAGLGISPQTLYHCPWKLPNYGKPDVGSNPGKLFYSTISKWLEVPEDDRRFAWESMSSRERREAMGRIPRVRKTA